jgi:hypothetical protein
VIAVAVWSPGAPEFGLAEDARISRDVPGHGLTPPAILRREVRTARVGSLLPVPMILGDRLGIVTEARTVNPGGEQAANAL